MRAAMAGPLTAVGGFHRNAPVFRPSPDEKLLGSGNGLMIAATAASSGLDCWLLPVGPGVRVSQVRTQPIEVGVAQSGTFNAPVPGSTSKMEWVGVGLLPRKQEEPDAAQSYR